MRILKGVHEIGFVHLTEEDVENHPSEKLSGLQRRRKRQREE